ncbi:hypothetical protein CR513_05746, partial [Mucuna pruriens]
MDKAPGRGYGEEGEHLKRIRQAWKKVVRKGSKWGLRSCGASSSYKSWLQHKIEFIFLTFYDPWFEAVENELAGLQRQLKRKRKELDSREAQEKGLRELERDQASLEKEELIAALVDARSKEDDTGDHLHRLQEQITLLEAKRLKEQASKYLEIAGHAEKVAQEAQEEARFWKDRFIKLAWVANQAIRDMPRSLRMVEEMALTAAVVCHRPPPFAAIYHRKVLSQYPVIESRRLSLSLPLSTAVHCCLPPLDRRSPPQAHCSIR